MTTFVAEGAVYNRTKLTEAVFVDEKLFLAGEAIVTVGAVTGETALLTDLSGSQQHIIESARYALSTVAQLPSHVELLVGLQRGVQVVVSVQQSD